MYLLEPKVSVSVSEISPHIKVQKHACFGQFLLILVLVAAAIGCYFPSLFSGFMSDDYFAYSYFFKALHLQPLSLLHNFTGSWMSSELRELHYRPFMIIPHLFDCLVWHLNPVGYHLTNLIIHAVCTVLVFLITKTILRSLHDSTNVLPSFLAALLFTVHPFHAEAVSWVSGRVDSFCTMLYLSSLFLFLSSQESNNQKLRTVSYICAFSSMMCKEIGVGLPAVLSLYVLCKRFGTEGIKSSIKNTLKETSIYWGLFIAYLALRTYALKTLFGGYVGLTGVLTDNIWLQRILDPKSYEKIFLPLPIEMVGKYNFNFVVLFLFNCLLAGLSLVRFWFCRPGFRFLRASLFTVGWIVIQFAIVARVWSATEGLAGGRQFYLLSVPYCILVALFLVPLCEKDKRHKILNIVAAVAMILYCSVLGVISFKQNKIWTDAAAYSKMFSAAILNQEQKLPTDSRILILNPPVTYEHMGLYPSYEVLRGLFEWPFCKPNLSNRICSLQPYFYNPNLINKSALNMVLKEGATKVICWNDDKKIASPLTYAPPNGPSSTDCHLDPVAHVDNAFIYRVVPNEPIRKQNIDCLEISVACKCNEIQNRKPHVLAFLWSDSAQASERNHKHSTLWQFNGDDGSQGERTVDKDERMATSLATLLTKDGHVHTYRFHLSEMTSWNLFGNLNSLTLMLTNPYFNKGKTDGVNYDIKSVKLLNLDNEIPSLSLDASLWHRNQNGTYSSNNKEKFVFNYDASKIKRAAQVLVEISKPDYFWEYFAGSYRQKKLADKRLTMLTLKRLSGQFTVNAAIFPCRGDYQIRITALDSTKNICSYVSDPVVVCVR